MIIYHNNTSCLKEYWLWQKVNIYFKPNELSLSCTVIVPEAVDLKNAEQDKLSFRAFWVRMSFIIFTLLSL